MTFFKGELASQITIGTASVQSRVENLKQLGLLNEEEMKVKPFKKLISLTEKGSLVANHIKTIEEYLEQ